MTILDTFVGKPLLGEGLASIVIHFRLPLGMNVSLNQESPIGLLGGFAQVSLLRLDPLFSCEQFVTGPELFFVIMIFIRKTLRFQGQQSVRCVRRFNK